MPPVREQVPDTITTARHSFHKAQGGQWAHVYVDQGYMTDDMLTPDYIHWLYTAFTRATERLFLVNWPKTQIK